MLTESVKETIFDEMPTPIRLVPVPKCVNEQQSARGRHVEADRHRAWNAGLFDQLVVARQDHAGEDSESR